MPQITIDGKRIEASAGKTIIEAATESGIMIPHFCWHPSLSVAGNCRMCLVNVGMPKRAPDGSTERNPDGSPVIQYAPKMQIACATPIADGMVVELSDKRTETAQNAVMEFLLINHPLDCPICDEAGTCKLQEYAFMHSVGKSRFDDPKWHKDKRVPLGPNVMYDAERCILCSRCIRFADEVAEQHVLTFVERNDHVYVDTFPGVTFDSQYSMNTIELCPVGALTSRDFRFKARVWEMSFNDSICPGCSRGCNMQIGVRDNQIQRLEPQTNMHVNKYWMCDHGRLAQYDFVNTNRIQEPMIRLDGQLVSVSWDDAYKSAANLLKRYKHSEIMVISSSRASNEDNYMLANFARKTLKTENIDFPLHTDESFADSFLRTADRSPNSHGASEVDAGNSRRGVDFAHLLARINSGAIKALYIMGEDFSDNAEVLVALGKVETLIVHASNNNAVTAAAHVVFAASTYSEAEGTYVNVQKRVQHFRPAVVTQENSRTTGMKMSRWDKFGTQYDRWAQGERRNCRQNWSIVQGVANLLGGNWHFKSSEEVFDDIVKHVAPFKGMSYELLDEYQGLILDKANSPEPKKEVYKSFTMKPN